LESLRVFNAITLLYLDEGVHFGTLFYLIQFVEKVHYLFLSVILLVLLQSHQSVLQCGHVLLLVLDERFAQQLGKYDFLQMSFALYNLELPPLVDKLGLQFSL